VPNAYHFQAVPDAIDLTSGLFTYYCKPFQVRFLLVHSFVAVDRISADLFWQIMLRTLTRFLLFAGDCTFLQFFNH